MVYVSYVAFVRFHIVDGMLQNGVTALHMAAFIGRVEIVRLLLEKEADPNFCNEVQHFICSKGAIGWWWTKFT